MMYNNMKMKQKEYWLELRFHFDISHNPNFLEGAAWIGEIPKKKVQEIRELRIATRRTNPIHNDVPENTTFLLLDQPSEEANTTGTLISKIDEVAINAKTANWKAIIMLVILQATNK